MGNGKSVCETGRETSLDHQKWDTRIRKKGPVNRQSRHDTTGICPKSVGFINGVFFLLCDIGPGQQSVK